MGGRYNFDAFITILSCFSPASRVDSAIGNGDLTVYSPAVLLDNPHVPITKSASEIDHIPQKTS
jgi:hypothetical protein